MNSSPRFTLALIAGDLAGVILAFNTVGFLRGIVALPDSPLLWPLLVPAALFIAALALIDGYSPRTDLLSLDYTSQHLIATILATLATLLITFVVFSSGLQLQQSRAVILLAFLLQAPWGLFIRRVLALRRAAVHRFHGVIFIGDPASGQTFAAECARIAFDRPVTYAALPSETAYANRPAVEELITSIEAGTLPVDAIVLRESAHNLPPDLPDRLMRLHFQGIPTYTLELFHEVIWRKIPLYRINPIWLFQGGFQIAREPIFDRLKRVCDLLLAFVVLLLAAPLLAIAAIAIKLEDRGPILFRQTRIGRHRHPFTLLKLRTMRATPGGDRYTAPGDRRITRVGALLRASRLDELPQLWNVFTGEMSMIGPRAEWDVLVADYEKQIPCYHYRHLVRPGITGWAQVNYPYGANLEDTARKLEYDLYYIRRYSLRLDAAIVLKTMHVMLFGKGGR